MDIRERVDREGGIVHRQELLDAGVSERRLRAALARGEVRRERRYWVATPTASPLLVTAARATAKVACVSAAHLRGWWMPPDVDPRVHLCVRPGAQRPAPPLVTHWSRPLMPTPPTTLVESVPDALEHIAGCATREIALVLWESAARTEAWDARALQRVRWRTEAARRMSDALTGKSDSGLETIVVVRLSPWGIRLRQQVRIAGHAVDILVGDRLILQIDGFAFHSSSADRTRDIAHDRELMARGYTVLRFSYAEVLHHWDRVEQSVARAIAQGLHRAA